METLQEQWVKLGGNEELNEEDRARVDGELLKLRKIIAPLGIVIENRRRVGWRLAEAQQDSETDS